jgi:hypothetical protein
VEEHFVYRVVQERGVDCDSTLVLMLLQADLNQAIAMVSYYASSSEPAQVRGKTVYLQYSNRQEIVTSKNSGDVASNVLLVTIEGVEAGDVSIDVLHLVSLSISNRGIGLS